MFRIAHKRNLGLCVLVFLLDSCRYVYSTFDFDELRELKYGIEITNKPVIFSKVKPKA